MIKRISKSLAWSVLAMFSVIILSKCSPLLPDIELFAKRPNIQGVVSYKMAKSFIRGLEAAKEDAKADKKIYIKIESWGGGVIAGHSMITAIKKAQSQGYKLICHADRAVSMAFTLLQYCDIRIGTDASIIMQHMTHDGNGRENMTFDTKEDSVQMAFFDRLHAIETSRRLGISFNTYLKRYKYSKWYVGMEACLDGVLDFVYLIRSKKTVSCKEYKRKYFLLKEYLFKALTNPKKATNAKSSK
jgi:ATP-dependent protease ClpP protease subunit